jgi:hypothetical protein
MVTRQTLLKGLVALFACLLIGTLATGTQAKGSNAKDIALIYVDSLSNSRISEWAAHDLGCLMRVKVRATGKRIPQEQSALYQTCWEDTMLAHRKLAEQKTETGVFGATSLGNNLGLLHERHRGAATWREYPPALFASPAIVRSQGGPAPRVQIIGATTAEPVSVVRIDGDKAVTLSGVGVDVQVSFVDPFAAPLALRPEEPWFAKGVTRRFGPIREVTARFVVVSGLRKFGFPIDMAVVNEALPDAPGIPIAQYGMNPDPGRPWVKPGSDLEHPPLMGGLVLGSARWWTQESMNEPIKRVVATLRQLAPGAERTMLAAQLRMIAPDHPEANAAIGDLYYDEFIAQGATKSRIRAENVDVRNRSLELYWTLQAQTWRQELTAVSNEYEPAAAALYGAIGAYEALLHSGTADSERRRRLGTLYRWNNDPESALRTHEQLLGEFGPSSQDSGRLLTEIAWDKIQWVSWNRIYDHPWLGQAQRRAKEAGERVHHPMDKLSASYAALVAEAVRVPRDNAAVNQQMQGVKSLYDEAGKIEGLWPFLAANDLVKSLVAESTGLSLPAPVRSEEVLDVRIHAQPPTQDLYRTWNFDDRAAGSTLDGFTLQATGSNSLGEWRIAPHGSAPSQPNALVPSGSCSAEPCFRFVTTRVENYAYPDVTASVLFSDNRAGHGAGLVVGAQGSTTCYFVILYPAEAMVKFYRLKEDQVTLLASERVRLSSKPWHSIRAQRANFAHVDHPHLAAYIDGYQIAVVPDDIIPPIDRYGVVVQGETTATFDSLHVLDLVTNRPMSKHSAY